MANRKPTGKAGFSKVNHVCMAIAVKMMFGNGATVLELMEGTGLCENSVRALVRAFQRQKVCYIADWHTDKWGRFTIRRYALGNLPDKPKPLPRRQRSD